MNKKAWIFEFGIDVLIVLIIMCIGVFFFMGFSVLKEKQVIKSIDERSSLIWRSDDMLTFLRQPKVFDFNSDNSAENGTIADLVVYSYENKEYDELEKELHNFFDDKFPSFYEAWSFVIYSLKEGKPVVIITKKDFSTHLSSRRPVSDLLIPSKEQNNPLRIVLFWDVGQVVALP
jgi:hypothetical protein